jgi:hypothetical protein
MAFGVVSAAVKPVVIRKLGVDFSRVWVLGNELPVLPPLGLKSDEELAQAMILLCVSISYKPEVDRKDACGS